MIFTPAQSTKSRRISSRSVPPYLASKMDTPSFSYDDEGDDTGLSGSELVEQSASGVVIVVVSLSIPQSSVAKGCEERDDTGLSGSELVDQSASESFVRKLEVCLG